MIYGTADLDRACIRLKAEYGLDSVAGGRHDGVGTHNRLVPLGADYVEVLAIADAAEAAASPVGRLLAEYIEQGDGLIGWAVAVADVAAVAERLGTDVIEIVRGGQTGRLTGMYEALEEPFLPFFIERGPTDAASGITWIEVAGDRRPARRVARRQIAAGCARCTCSPAVRRCSRSASATSSCVRADRGRSDAAG